jgi:hypothetical protein
VGLVVLKAGQGGNGEGSLKSSTKLKKNKGYFKGINVVLLGILGVFTCVLFVSHCFF